MSQRAKRRLTLSIPLLAIAGWAVLGLLRPGQTKEALANCEPSVEIEGGPIIYAAGGCDFTLIANGDCADNPCDCCNDLTCGASATCSYPANDNCHYEWEMVSGQGTVTHTFLGAGTSHADFSFTGPDLGGPTVVKVTFDDGNATDTVEIRRAPALCSASLGDGGGCPGQTVPLTCIITNTGSCPATYSWQVTQTGGNATVNPASGPPITLAAGASATTPVNVDIGSSSPPGSTATLKLEVSEGGGVSCSDTGTVSVSNTPCTAVLSNAEGCAGTTVPVGCIIKNTGSCEATYSWTVTQTGGNATVTPGTGAPITLGPGEIADSPVNVAIASTSPPGSSATLQLDVNVNGVPTCSDTATVNVLQGTANTPFPATSAAISGGAAPSNTLGPCDYGMTFPESVSVTIGAECKNNQWCAVLTSLTGAYSQQVRLLPGQMEVTGPGGNTNSGNYCAQVTELNDLGYCPGAWYMLAAVQAHEDVHLAHFEPAIEAKASAIESLFEALCVPHTQGMTEAQAIAAIQGSGDYAQARTDAYNLWLNETSSRIANDHNGPTDAAEHGIVDPMIMSICNQAAAQTPPWTACQCPPP
jgi:hypothetical protein